MPHRLAAITFASGLLLASAAAYGHDMVSLLEARRLGVTVQKFDISCGAAAEATLLHLKFNDNVSERDVALHLMTRKEYLEHPQIIRAREGFSLLDLKRYAVSRGYRAEGLGQMTQDDLIAVAPAIVPLRLYGYNHFVVFRGIVGDRVVLADPAFGNRVMPLWRFQDTWIELKPLGHVAFVIKRAGEK